MKYYPRRKSHRRLVEPLPAHVRLQVLRLLVLGDHLHDFVMAEGFSDTQLAISLGLNPPNDDDNVEDFDRKAAMRTIRKMYLDAQKSAGTSDRGVLRLNIDDLGELVGFPAICRDLLELVVNLRVNPSLTGLDDLVGPLSTTRLHTIIAVMLDVSTADVRAALATDGVLHLSGILRVDHSQTYPLSGKLDFPGADFVERLATYRCDKPLALLKGCVSRSPSPELRVADFGHIPLAKSLVKYMRQSVENRASGQAVFVYGRSGCGKTQLARAVAFEAGIDSYEIASIGPDNAPLDADDRIAAYRLAAQILKHRNAIIIFDEFQDVTDQRLGRFFNSSAISKASIHSLFETCPPAIFISNDGDVDPALLRRALVVSAKPPSTARRRDLVERALGKGEDARIVDAIVHNRNASPAIVARARDIAATIEPNCDGSRRETFLEIVNESIHAASGRDPRLTREANRKKPAELYDPTLSNSDVDLKTLAAAITGDCRISLAGPSGLGKTAFGRWLAMQIDAPLHVKRASDLLGSYVGETERNIADAFTAAENDSAVLLVDEADSFLRSRKKADSQWQQTMANEFLTQMEEFSGVLVLTTNHFDDLSSAVHRRLDFRIRLDWLKPAQLQTLLVRHADLLGLKAPSESCLHRVATLTCVAPGDFSVVARQARFRAVANPDEFVDRLIEQTAHKSGKAGRPIGFLS